MLDVLQSALKRKKYKIVAAVAAGIAGVISYFLTVVNVSEMSIRIYAEMNGGFFTVLTLIFSAAISIFIGLYFSLLLFRRDLVMAMSVKDNVSGLSGMGIAAVVTGCPSCGTPLLGLIGFPFALYFLPFKGLEFKLLSVILLAIAVASVLKSIKKTLACETKKP